MNESASATVPSLREDVAIPSRRQISCLPRIGLLLARGTSLACEEPGGDLHAKAIWEFPYMDRLTSARLLLRRWTDEDLPAFAHMGASPEVMKYFPALLSREESDAVATRIRARTEEFGFGFWALEIPGVTPFAGFVGLSVPGFEAHFTPCVEIGWRLAPAYWGKGYATEAASLALDFAFGERNLQEIVAFTAVQNSPSRRVMERLGMRHDSADDFDHPVLAQGHPLQRHVLYRITGEEWKQRSRSPVPVA